MNDTRVVLGYVYGRINGSSCLRRAVRVLEAAINDALQRLLRPAPDDKMALWAAQLGGVMPPLLRSSRPPMRVDGPTQCERGHPLTHEHAADHLGRCRRCVSQGKAA